MERETARLLEEIDRAFPKIRKPEGTRVSVHETGCEWCRYLREDLESYTDGDLPDHIIRYLHGELSCLSNAGLQWVLRAYLRRCVTQDAYFDPIETEYLIYTLSPAEEFREETRGRFAGFSEAQLLCLSHFLDWCREHPHWSAYCPEEIATGTEFVASLICEHGGT